MKRLTHRREHDGAVCLNIRKKDILTGYDDLVQKYVPKAIEKLCAYEDNPKVIRERGANHLVIAVYRDHWHVAQVGGYTPDTGLYTKLY